jgi:PAS domain S-box-containing protein
MPSGETWLDQNFADNIIGHLMVSDYAGSSLGMLHFVMPREVSIVGRKNIVDIMFGLAVIFSVSAFANYILLRVLIINKLLSINDEVAKVSGKEGLVVRIKELGGKDELTQLTKNINAMLLRLSASTELAQTGRANVRSYIDIVGVMIVVVDPDQKIILINKKSAEVLGVSQEAAIGMNWYDNFVEEQVRAQAKADFEKLMHGESIELNNYENEVITKNGNRLISWHKSVIKDNEGKIVATMSAGDDITDEKLAEAERARKAKEIESLNDLMVGRELKMFEMKAKLNKMKVEEGK